MKVVVTGATGQLGQQVVALLLEAGHHVLAVSRSGGTADHRSGLQWLRLDLAREDAVADLRPHLGPETAVVHLAAHKPPSPTDAAQRRELLDPNVFGTLRLLDAARGEAGGARVVVYACDAEVYGASPPGERLDEGAFLRPASDYAVSKLSGEDHLFAFAFEEQVRCVSLRLGAFYGAGPRARGLCTTLLEACARGEAPVVFGRAEDRCPRVHVRDAARAVERALLAPVSGRFNIADGDSQSLAQITRLASAVCGVTLEPRFDSSREHPVGLDLALDRARTELGFTANLGLEDALREGWQQLQSGR